MNITSAKVELAKFILDIDDPELIERIHDLLMKEESDFWVQLSEEEKQEIKFAISQLDKGKKISFESYMEKIS
jgi:hypothetical protein